MITKYRFFDKKCVIDRELSNQDNLALQLSAEDIKFSSINFVNQIHSDQVIIIDDVKKIYGKQNLPKADAIVTNLPSLAIAIITADCAPILLQDDTNKIIAAVHAGWRGAKLNIIANAVKAMEKLGANKELIVANIGPMIHQESYEVGQDFFDEFIAEEKSNANFFHKSLSGRYLFDLPSYVMQKLQKSGVGNIQNCNINTYVNENYASYRRATHNNSLAVCGRNISLIVMDNC